MYRCFDPNDSSFLAHKAEEARIARAREEEAARATRVREEEAAQAAIAHADEAACADNIKPSLCANAPKPLTCFDGDAAAIDQRQKALANAAMQSCESRFSDANGKGVFTCGLVATSQSAPKDPKRGILDIGRTTPYSSMT